ncbi:MAG: hypothetical protein ACLU0O_04135 [Collinsella sp.]
MVLALAGNPPCATLSRTVAPLRMPDKGTLMKNTQLLLINDMCGYGKVALSAMLPVLSHGLPYSQPADGA